MERISYVVSKQGRDGKRFRYHGFDLEVDWFNGPDYSEIENRIAKENPGWTLEQIEIPGFETTRYDASPRFDTYNTKTEELANRREKFSWPERPNLAKLCSPLHADVFHAIREWRAARKAGAAADSLAELFRQEYQNEWRHQCLVCGKYLDAPLVDVELCTGCEWWAARVFHRLGPDAFSMIAVPEWLALPPKKRRPKFFVTERAIPPSRVDTKIPW